MSDLPISDEALKAASEAAHTQMTLFSLDRRDWPEVIEAAIQAFLVAEGFEIEQSDAMTLWVPDVAASRLVSPWKLAS